MTSELRNFRHLEEPMGGYQIRSLDFSPQNDLLAVAGSSAQPVILDRDGRKQTTLMRGDMYIRDMRKTRGHVAGCTTASSIRLMAMCSRRPRRMGRSACGMSPSRASAVTTRRASAFRAVRRA